MLDNTIIPVKADDSIEAAVISLIFIAVGFIMGYMVGTHSLQ